MASTIPPVIKQQLDPLARSLGAPRDIVNPHGGAVALGHALEGCEALLLTNAVHELERINKTNAPITMCRGGGLGTETIIQLL